MSRTSSAPHGTDLTLEDLDPYGRLDGYDLEVASVVFGRPFRRPLPAQYGPLLPKDEPKPAHDTPAE